MKTLPFYLKLLLVSLVILHPGSLKAQKTALNQVQLTYQDRMREAIASLESAREKILAEKAPLNQSIQELNDKALELNARILQLKKADGHLLNEKKNLEAEIEALRNNLNYAVMLSEEALTGMQALLVPGESLFYGPDINRYMARLGSSDGAGKPLFARETLDLILKRLQRQVGGYVHSGQSLYQDDNKVYEGTYYFMGPISYFFDETGKTGGLAINREQSYLPVTYPLPQLGTQQIADLKEGKRTRIPVDVTGGKALHLKEARGSVWEHIQKGGIVGYSILFLGAFALLTGLLKLWDIRELSVDKPKDIQAALGQMQPGDVDPARSPWNRLRKSSRELFAIGLKHRDKPRDLLEELMYAHVLLQRNHHERRLPLLKVIAAAAPLLGLLGTVVGMMKTFTLITVFGTGNASKLSSGISEALVTTEMGLMVAIPTLVIYGYLAHNTERKLLLLEQYATDFVNAFSARQITREEKVSA